MSNKTEIKKKPLDVDDIQEPQRLYKILAESPLAPSEKIEKEVPFEDMVYAMLKNMNGILNMLVRAQRMSGSRPLAGNFKGD